MITVTIKNVKANLANNYSIVIGDPNCIQQFQDLIKTQFPDFYWTYFYEEDTIQIGGIPNDTQLSSDIFQGKLGDVISVVGNSE